MRRRTAGAAGTLLALTVAAEAGAVVLSWDLESRADTVLYALAAPLTAGAGALVAARHPRNPIGWLLAGFALLTAICADLVQGWGLRAAEQGWPGVEPAELVTWSAWLPSGFGWTMTLLLFPDGRLPGPRWRAVPWLAAAGLALALPGWALDPARARDYSGGVNPYAAESVPTDLLLALGMALVIGTLVASAASLLVRFRRARGEERQQLTWIAAGAAYLGIALPGSFVFWYSAPVLGQALAISALTLLPVVVCVAILRYRLYEIDVILDRTVVYATVSALLAAAYGATTVLLGTALGRGSGWVTAAATLVVAVAFRPLRDRVQDVVDRRFHRARYRAVRRMSAFLDELRAGHAAPEEVEPLLRELTGDPGLRLLVWLPESREYADGNGDPVPGQPDGLVVERAGRPLGLVLHERAEPRLLRVLVEAGGLAIEITRLNTELRRRLADVRASRARIVTAAAEERRRLERDLHDGAQQRLVAIGLALRHAQHELGRDAVAEAGRTLEEAVTEVTVAIEELRELARGLPPALLDSGLAPAFRDLARRAPVPVQVSAPRERFDSGLEGAAYFIGAEGLTNAVKHARAGRIALTAERRDGVLVVEVADDGVGGALPAPGSGLTGLADRVSALGGVLRIESLPGAGTTLVAELPCGS